MLKNEKPSHHAISHFKRKIKLIHVWINHLQNADVKTENINYYCSIKCWNIIQTDNIYPTIIIIKQKNLQEWGDIILSF